jgi:hypothetical protein
MVLRRLVLCALLMVQPFSASANDLCASSTYQHVPIAASVHLSCRQVRYVFETMECCTGRSFPLPLTVSGRCLSCEQTERLYSEQCNGSPDATTKMGPVEVCD